MEAADVAVVVEAAAAEDAIKEAPEVVIRADEVAEAEDETGVAKAKVRNNDNASTPLSIAGRTVLVPTPVGSVKIHRRDTSIKLRLTTN